MSEEHATPVAPGEPCQSPPWLKWPDSAQGYPHTVTFYSFKGGVGRTLALLNVAVLLAKKGNRVCIADFDLEAPGVDSYPGFEPSKPDQPGIVEFVSDYLADPKKIAPSCGNYIYECKLKDAPSSAALFVMRAGRQDGAYRQKLGELDWNKLFERYDGLPLFENLKGELFDDYGCNFLLLDSRTGLTDVGGLCTGILPDAVVLMFFPDTQNQRGIETVGRAIRKYAEREDRRIDRMYCVSRVPGIAEKRRESDRIAVELCQRIEVDERIDFYNDAGWDSSHGESWNPNWEWSAMEVFVHDPPGDLLLPAFDVMKVQFAIPPDRRADDDICLGGLPIARIDERQSLEHGIVARDHPADPSCLQYMHIATFVSCANLWERMQFQRAVDAFGKRWQSVAEETVSDKYVAKQLAYFRRWHPDIRPGFERHSPFAEFQPGQTDTRDKEP